MVSFLWYSGLDKAHCSMESLYSGHQAVNVDSVPQRCMHRILESTIKRKLIVSMYSWRKQLLLQAVSKLKLSITVVRFVLVRGAQSKKLQHVTI